MNAGMALRLFTFLATKTETVGDLTVIFVATNKIYFKLLYWPNLYYRRMICLSVQNTANSLIVLIFSGSSDGN